jgi:hypothetical protein
MGGERSGDGIRERVPLGCLWGPDLPRGEGNREERRQRNRETEKKRSTYLYFMRGCRSFIGQIARTVALFLRDCKMQNSTGIWPF